MSEAIGFLFLCGADMDPSLIRAAHPSARFEARARYAGPDGEVWGILLAGVSNADDAPFVDVVTDDSRSFRAALPSAAPAGDPAAVLAAARYWELPPAYVRRLAAAQGETADRD